MPVSVEEGSTEKRRKYIVATVLALGACTLLIGLFQTDARSVGDLGLISAIPRFALAGAAVMVVAAVLSILSPTFDERLSALCVVTLVALVSAAPAIVYDTARFSWAFKHIGLVDYITRTGGFDREIDVLTIYHSWPGFFAGSASLTDWLGLDDAIVVATWAPVGLNLMTLAGLVYLLGQFTESRQTVWLAALLFFVTNWIGQDYFSPQAVAFVLYLVIMATTLRFYLGRTAQGPTLAVHLVMVLLVLTLAATHQLTPLVLLAALAGSFVLTRSSTASIPLIATALAWAFWLSSWARSFVESGLEDELTVGSPVSNAVETLGRANVRSDAQELVALAGRGLIAGIGLLGLAGLVRRLLRRETDGAAIVMLGAPGVIGVLEFGGEILFRIALFMLPVLCLLAAEVLMTVRPAAMRALVAAGIALACFAAFGLAYFGKDGFYSFTNDELAVVGQLMDDAPENALLVEGSRNYPTQFLEYEKFTYVPIDREVAETQDRIAAAPGDELHRWLANDAYEATYLLLTRSQQKEAAALGSLPIDYLPNIETALRADPRFVVVIENSDAVVFTVTGP